MSTAPQVPGAVVTVAVNGYGLIHPLCRRSAAAYARRRGYRLVRLTARRVRVDRHDAAWVKLDMLASVLETGVPWVVLVDADARVSRRTPALASVAQVGYDVHAVKGWSGRWNSGVLIVHNTASSRELLRRVRAGWETPSPDGAWGDWADWGENGHVVYELDRYARVAELPLAWNNTVDPELADFVRHQTGELTRRNTRLDHHVRRLVHRLYRNRPSLTALRPDRADRLAWLVEQARTGAAAPPLTACASAEPA